jgi:hypothetical protein
MELKYILKIFIFAFLILSLIIFINTIGLTLKDEPINKKLLKVVTIEGFNNTAHPNSLILNTSDDFCESHRGSSGTLEQSCGKLTKNNCNNTSCCVWSSENKCVAGSIKGPTYNSDSNGKTKELDYYYFEGKCYGKNCLKVV